MPSRIEMVSEVLDDLDRFIEHQERHAMEDGPERIAELLAAFEVLASSPGIGRPVKGGMRELIIGRGSRGYVALYRFVPAIDTVFILAVRGQRESGDTRER